MRIHSTLLAFALAALPAIAVAQRGVNVRGERAGDVGGRGFDMPKSSELEDHSPVGVVLDKKKRLALTDSQVTSLKGIAKGLRQKNGAFYRGWDSVRVTMRSASGGAFGGAFGGGGGGRGSAGVGGASELDREALGTARTHMMGLLRAIRDGNEWSRQETLKVLTPEQQAQAEEYWKDDAEEFGRSLPGSGPGRGPGGGPGGGRPSGGRSPARG